MKKLLLIAFLLPMCATTLSITTGCGKEEAKVVDPPEIDEAAEADQANADDESAPE